MLVLAALALAVWFGRKLLPSDQARIRHLIVRLLNTASIKPNESTFARLAAANHIADFFTPDAQIHLEALGGEVPSIENRNDLVQAALAAQRRLHYAQFELGDCQVSFPEDKRTASAYVFVVATTDLQTNRWTHPLRVSLVRTNGQWLIAGVTATQGLE